MNKKKSQIDKSINNNLKSCPFCGSHDLFNYAIYIKCKNCLCNGPKMNYGVHDEHVDYVDEKNAIKAWNKRK